MKRQSILFRFLKFFRKKKKPFNFKEELLKSIKRNSEILTRLSKK